MFELFFYGLLLAALVIIAWRIITEFIFMCYTLLVYGIFLIPYYESDHLNIAKLEIEYEMESDCKVKEKLKNKLDCLYDIHHKQDKFSELEAVLIGIMLIALVIFLAVHFFQ